MRISRRYGVEHLLAGWICLACGNVGPSAPRCDSSGLVRTGVYHDVRGTARATTRDSRIISGVCP